MAGFFEFLTSPYWTKAEDDKARSDAQAAKHAEKKPVVAKVTETEKAPLPDEPAVVARKTTPKQKTNRPAETYGYADADLQLALQKRGHFTGWNNDQNFKKHGDDARMDELLGKHTRKAISLELGRSFRGPITHAVRAELEEKMPEYAALRRREGAAERVAAAADQLGTAEREALGRVRIADSGSFAPTVATSLKPARSVLV